MLAQLVAYLRDVPMGETYELEREKDRMVFRFADAEVEGKEAWKAELTGRGVTNAYAFYALGDRDRGEPYADFVWEGRQGLLTVFRDGRKTYWTVRSEFDRNAKDRQHPFVYTFTENDFPTAPAGLPQFANCTEEYRRFLAEIAAFAEEIGQRYYAERFRKALARLTDADVVIPEWTRNHFPRMTTEQFRLYAASIDADVFAKENGWEDEAAAAVKAGRWEEYDRLTKELQWQNKRAELYAANAR